MTTPRKSPLSKSLPPRDLAARARAAASVCIGRSTRIMMRRIVQRFDEALAPHEMTFPQFGMLLAIAGAKDDTLAAIAAGMEIDASTLTRNLQGLEKLGLVEIAAVESDMRKRAVWLTETGARRLAAALPAWEATQSDIAARLGPRLTADLAKAGGLL
jgi:DNA-binding MarR family transcriptional regulator